MKHLICLILGLFWYHKAAANTNLVAINNNDTTTVASADSTRNSFTVGLLAGNNSYFFGRSTDIAYPYLAANLSYKFKSGFWLGTTLYHIKGVKNYIDETNLTAGWDVALSDRLEGSVSYTRYIYGSDNPLLQSVASNLATATLSYDWSYLYTSLTANYLFGEFNDAFLSLNNSRYFEKKGIFSQTDYLGIDPAINVLAGTQYFTQSYTTKVEETLTDNNGNGNGNNGNGNGNGNSGNNGNNGNGNGNNGNGNGNNGNGNGNNGTGNGNNGNTGTGNTGNGNTGTGTGTTTTTTTTIIQESKFTLLNYGITLPVIYGFGNNSFELSWRLLVPTNVTEEFSSKPRSFLTFSYYHTF